MRKRHCFAGNNSSIPCEDGNRAGMLQLGRWHLRNQGHKRLQVSWINIECNVSKELNGECLFKSLADKAELAELLTRGYLDMNSR